jgi:predicted enzyme related to lactoylglutathione lyase
LERAKSFYGALLGWMCEAGASGLTTIINAGNRIGTIRDQAGRRGAGERSWTGYVGVESAAEAADKAERNGGRAVSDRPTARSDGRHCLRIRKVRRLRSSSCAANDEFA